MRGLSHRDEILNTLQRLKAGTSMDLQNASMMQDLQRNQGLIPLQQQQLQGAIEGQGLQNQMQQAELGGYDEQMAAKVAAMQAQANESLGQGAYYGAQVMDPYLQRQIFQRMGMEPNPMQMEEEAKQHQLKMDAMNRINLKGGR